MKTQSAVIAVPISRRALRAKMRKLDSMQERNWQKHFVEHPEQLLPGAEVKRMLPMEEAGLLAEIIGANLFVK